MWRRLVAFSIGCGLTLLLYLAWRLNGVYMWRSLLFAARMLPKLGCTEISFVDGPVTPQRRQGDRRTSTAGRSI